MLLGLRPRADHEDRARAVAGADEDVPRAAGAVEPVPLVERALLLLDEEQTGALEDEEPLLAASPGGSDTRPGPARARGRSRRSRATRCSSPSSGRTVPEEGFAYARASARSRTNQPSEVIVPAVLAVLRRRLRDAARPSCADEPHDLVPTALHVLLRERLEVQAQQRLGVRRAHVEVPVVEVDRDAVEVRDPRSLGGDSAPSSSCSFSATSATGVLISPVRKYCDAERREDLRRASRSAPRGARA